MDNLFTAGAAAGDPGMHRSDTAPPQWAPLSKAQCLLLAIELRRLRVVTRAHWALPAEGDARFE